MPTTEPIVHVTPITKGKSDTDAEKVTLTVNHLAAAKLSADWANAPLVQSAFALWSAGATDLGNNSTLIANLKSQLSMAETQQKALRLAWAVQQRGVLVAVALYCAGVAKTMLGLGFGARTFGAIGALPAVEGLTTKLGKIAGETIVAWLRGDAHHGFLVQHATDINNPATFSTPQPCTKIKDRARRAAVGDRGAGAGVRDRSDAEERAGAVERVDRGDGEVSSRGATSRGRPATGSTARRRRPPRRA